jgi:hypothetical protein
MYKQPTVGCLGYFFDREIEEMTVLRILNLFPKVSFNSGISSNRSRIEKIGVGSIFLWQEASTLIVCLRLTLYVPP